MTSRNLPHVVPRDEVISMMEALQRRLAQPARLEQDLTSISARMIEIRQDAMDILRAYNEGESAKVVQDMLRSLIAKAYVS